MRRIFLSIAALALMLVTADSAFAQRWSGRVGGFSWSVPTYSYGYYPSTVTVGDTVIRTGYYDGGYYYGSPTYGYYSSPVYYSTPSYYYSTPSYYYSTPVYYTYPRYRWGGWGWRW
jgi:hypothetical protein